MAFHMLKTGGGVAGGCVAFLGAVYIGKQPLSWLQLETDTKLLAICGASALWGIYTAAQPVVESIFADSVPTGALPWEQAQTDQALGHSLQPASMGTTKLP